MNEGYWTKELETVEKDIDDGYYDHNPSGLDRALDYRSQCLAALNEPLTLKIPTNIDIFEAAYWYGRAEGLAGGREIKVEFVQGFQK